MSETEARFRGSSREWRIVAGQVHTLALRVARNRSLAEDLAQEVLKCLVQKGAEVGDVISWARTALVRLHSKVVRRQARTEPIEEGTSPSVVATGEVRVQLQQALALVPDRDRALLTWSSAGVAHREIAERLGCRAGDVGTMLARAQERARRRFSAQSQEEMQKVSSRCQKTHVSRLLDS